MSKIDTLFTKIIRDESFANYFDIQPSLYNTLEEGKRSLNPHIKAVAELLDQLNQKISIAQSDMRIFNKVGHVILADSDQQAIYRKIVSLLSK